IDTAVRAERGRDLAGNRARRRQQRARPAGLVLRDCLEEVFARLLLDAGYTDHAAAPAGLLEPLDGIDAEQLPEGAGGARAETADLEQAEKVGRQVFAQPIEELEPPGRQVLVDAGGDLLADAGQRAQGAARGDRGNVLGERFQRLTGALPRTDTEA